MTNPNVDPDWKADEPWTADDERIYNTRMKILEAEDRLAALRDRLQDNIRQARSGVKTDALLCPVCGEKIRPNYEIKVGYIRPHPADRLGELCPGSGLGL